MWCAVLHAAARSLSAFAPAPQRSTLPAAALPSARCKTRSPAPTGPGTTIAAAQTTAATLAHDLLSPAAAPQRHARRATLARSSRPVPPPSAAQTNSAAAPLPQILPAPATSPASPATSDHPTRRSSLQLPRPRRAALPPRYSPATLPLPCAAAHSLLHAPPHLHAAPAPCDPPCHSASAATLLTAPVLPAPCSPAGAPLDIHVNSLCSTPRPQAPHSPPAALHAPPRLLHARCH